MHKSIFSSNHPVCRAALLALAAGALLTAATPSRADDPLRYRGKPLGSKVHLDGTSTIHDWTMDSTYINGTFEVPAGVSLDWSQATPAGLKGKIDAKADVSIPVRQLKGSHAGMDEVMQQAMNAAEHPKIQYFLTEMTFKEPHTAGTPLAFDTKGDLVVNGVTNKIAMPVAITTMDKTKLKVVGSIPLKMSDFKVKPPTLLVGGMIKTGDDVKVAFEWLIGLPEK